MWRRKKGYYCRLFVVCLFALPMLFSCHSRTNIFKKEMPWKSHINTHTLTKFPLWVLGLLGCTHFVQKNSCSIPAWTYLWLNCKRNVWVVTVTNLRLALVVYRTTHPQCFVTEKILHWMLWLNHKKSTKTGYKCFNLMGISDTVLWGQKIT